MKLSRLASTKLQTVAISAAFALSIVAGGIALRLNVANRATISAQAHAQAHNQAHAQAHNQSTLPDRKPQPSAASSTTAHAARSESPVATSADISKPKTDSAKPSQAPQRSALSITPIQPAANPTAAPIGPSSEFNHLPYKEADPARLQPVGTFARDDFERTERLDLEAANAFIIMVREAQAQGVNLMPISGFRSVAEQQGLFAEQTERYGSEVAAAKLSAPPEHSEHHTGYAFDMGDRHRPDTDLASQFAETTAYQWLLNNAFIFGFEQSFPKNNAQGVNFEPWHWRYVQSERALQIFAAAKAIETQP